MLVPSPVIKDRKAFTAYHSAFSWKRYFSEIPKDILRNITKYRINQSVALLIIKALYRKYISVFPPICTIQNQPHSNIFRKVNIHEITPAWKKNPNTKISLSTAWLWKLNVKLSLRESQLPILWSCFSLIVLRCKCKQCRVTFFTWEENQKQIINTVAGSEASCSLSWNNITYLDMFSCWEAGEAKVLLKGHLRHFCT